MYQQDTICFLGCQLLQRSLGLSLVVITFEFLRSRASTSEYQQLPINCRLFQYTVNLQDKFFSPRKLKSEIKNKKSEIITQKIVTL